MRNRWRIWIVLLALSCCALTAYCEPTHCVRGWVRGEACFEWRPTSYWRGRIERWLEKYDSPELAAQSLLVTPTGVAEFDLRALM